MGNQKQKWTADEENALLAGVNKHGPGKWKNILKDPEFADSLITRSNIDLKDKWRNLSVSNSAPGSREKRSSKPKASIPAITYTQSPAPASLPADNLHCDRIADEAQNGPLDGSNTAKYNALIFEALSTVKDNSGLDISAIVKFIEQRHEVPPNFRKQITGRLRRLVGKGKLERSAFHNLRLKSYDNKRKEDFGLKLNLSRLNDSSILHIIEVQNCYRQPTTALGPVAPIEKPKDVKLRPLQTVCAVSGETVEDAALTAAYKVAEAENKAFLAAEAVKEAERVCKMAEDADSMLQLVKEIYEQCSHGETVLLA